MTRAAPILCVYREGAFHPSNARQQALADELYGKGELVALDRREERSGKSHRHYFAAIREAWKNLPEGLEFEPWAASPEHLRAYALIRCGYHDAQSIDCGSKAAAARLAHEIRPQLSEYAIISARDAMLHIFTPKSQSVRAMGKKAFYESKEKVLAFIADLLGVEVSQLPKENAA